MAAQRGNWPRIYRKATRNTYLGLFADTGFPGLILFVMLYGYLLKECFSNSEILGSRRSL